MTSTIAVPHSTNNQINIMASLEELSRLAERLNKQTDAVQEALTATQTALAHLNMGVEAWITIEETDGQESTHDERDTLRFTRYTEVGYGRFNRSWMLLHRETKMYEEHGGERREELIRVGDLLAAPRALRLEAAAHLPTLLDAVASEAERLLESSSKGLEGAREVLERHTKRPAEKTPAGAFTEIPAPQGALPNKRRQ